jgi:catalase
MGATASGLSPAKDRTYEQILDALQTLFGKHPGFRPIHAKGMLCKGHFTPTASASAFCRAPHFQKSSGVPIVVRFSDFTGIPTIADNDSNASPRGLAVGFHLADRAFTDVVAHSYNGFPVATVEEFLQFLQAVIASNSEAPSPGPLEELFRNHPRAKQFAETAKPMPESFATECYYAVDAFRFTDLDGVSRYGRLRFVPAAGAKYIDATSAATLSTNYLFDEMSERIKRQPVEFRLVVQLAADGDPINDASQPWPESRAQMNLGLLSITSLVPDSDAMQRTLCFDPANLVDGIEPSDDPLIRARSKIYALSFKRRNAAQ